MHVHRPESIIHDYIMWKRFTGNRYYRTISHKFRPVRHSGSQWSGEREYPLGTGAGWMPLSSQLTVCT